MAAIVSAIGTAVAAIGVLGIGAPNLLVHLIVTWRFLTRLSTTVALRIGFGVLFLLAAPSCRLPEFIRVVGVAELASAVLLLGLGPERLDRFVTWWVERPASFVRSWCSAALALGALLVYSGGWFSQTS